jgi:hypothetical protein
VSVQPAHDRLQYLLSEQAVPVWNGIDYIEIASPDQTQLRVHFLNATPLHGTLSATPSVTICGGETIGSVAVLPFDEATAWSADDAGRPVLSIAVAAPGDFSIYTLTVYSTALDPYFDAVPFTFKAGCPSQLDCRTPAAACPTPASESVPINYLAKDFTSFTQALSDFSALRYPLWVERSEADVGVMLIEALSAIADELSYQQDRVAGEATLPTATQRLSLVRHARLVDYEPTPALAATTVIQLDVAASVTALRTGLRVSALGADGRSIPFELGASLADPATGELEASCYAVDPRWNAGPAGDRNLVPYWWDNERQCLPPGSTRLWLIGQGYGLGPGQQLLVDTAGVTSADPPVRELVLIGQVAETVDPVYYVPLTRVDLQAPTSVEHDLTRTHYAGNLLPAVQGERTSEAFTIPPGPDSRTVVVRTAANWTLDNPRPDYRFSLAQAAISWLPSAATAYVPALAPPPDLFLQPGTSGGSLAGATYAYQVTAVSDNGETTALPAQSVAVTGPTGSVTLTWTRVSATATYNVYGRSAGSIGKLAMVGPFGAGEQPMYTDTGLATPDPAITPPPANASAGSTDYAPDPDVNSHVAADPQIALVASNPPAIWSWQRWLLGSGPGDTVFTLTPERYGAVAADGGRTWLDYQGEIRASRRPR